MLASEVITLTRNLLNDNVNYASSSPGIESAQSFSAPMYLDAINWACKQYALKTHATYTEVAIQADSTNSTLAVPLDNLDVVRVLTSAAVAPPGAPTWDSPTEVWPYAEFTVTVTGGIGYSFGSRDESNCTPNFITDPSANPVTILVSDDTEPSQFTLYCDVSMAGGTTYPLSQVITMKYA